MAKLRVAYKIWLEHEGISFFGKGGAQLLKLIDERGYLKKAAEEMEISYKFAWSYVKRLEEVLSLKIVESRRGGIGGGGSKLTREGKLLVEYYEGLASEVDGVAKKYERLFQDLLEKR